MILNQLELNEKKRKYKFIADTGGNKAMIYICLQAGQQENKNNQYRGETINRKVN